MKTLEKGQDKIQKIIEELRKDTLEPAQKEADRIIAEAQARAQELVRAADKKAEDLLEQARLLIEQEQNIFQSSLSQGVKQSVEALRQEIEHRLFNDQLNESLSKETSNPAVIAKIVETLITAIQRDGVSADFSAIIPQQISAHEVNAHLAKEILQKLRGDTVAVGNFGGGAKIKLNDRGLTIDISDVALRELLSRYLRKDFRHLVFGT